MDWVPWRDAVIVAGALGATTFALGDRANPIASGVRTWTRELTLMFALYSLWQFAGELSVAQQGDAISRGRDIIRFERWAHLPSERWTQSLVLGDRGLLRALNYYYADVHVAALGVCLLWLFTRHRDRYPAVRNVVVIVTGVSLLIELIPVAPPRLTPGLGVLDIGHLIGPSVYPDSVKPGLDQLSAMPSLHVGWAIIVAGAVVYALHSRWRWLAVLYPVATTWIVVVTGNHYWADGLAELGICAFAFVMARAIQKLARRPAVIYAARAEPLVAGGSGGEGVRERDEVYG